MTNKRDIDKMDNNNVAYKTKSVLNQDGEQTNRLMLVLRTPPCEYNQCTMCGFDNNAGRNIRLQNIQQQYQNGISGEDFSDIRRIDFPTAGSFYNDRELSPESRNYLFSEVSKLPIDSVMVETRVDYLTEEKVNESKSHLREDQGIELAIGLESADDNIRNKVLRKGLSKKGFERFADICKNTDSQLLAYVLIKSPSLSEAEAVKDAVQTADYVYRIANERGIKARVAFKPMFIPEGTELEERVDRNFMGETGEVGLYLAMARQAQEQGYPEVALTLKEIAFEEAAHAARFAEMNGKISPSIKENIEKMLQGELGAQAKKADGAKESREAGIDCAHNFFSESSHDEGRHAAILQGLLKRYFA